SPPPPPFYPLSLHDALPIYRGAADSDRSRDRRLQLIARHSRHEIQAVVDDLGELPELHAIADEVGTHGDGDVARHFALARRQQRSEEHTSELQSRENLVCRL